MFRRIALALAILLATLAGSAAAEQDETLRRIGTMSLRELDALIGTVTAAVSKDTLAMRDFAQTGNCLELTRSANSFQLGYGYLAAIRDRLRPDSEIEAQVIRAKAVQARVVTFAARIRVEDWLAQSCRSFVATGEQADDPRYGKPLSIADREYTEALIEGRQVSDTNFAIALAAGRSRSCPEIVASGRNVQLLVPYLNKLINETADRPLVLGPVASRRGLELSRDRLVATANQLVAQFGPTCAPQPAPPAAE